MDVVFCFLTVGDLRKEHIWIKWFEGLQKLGMKHQIVVHCSMPDTIQSEWFRPYLVPDTYLRPTSWGFLMNASLSMYAYAYQTTKAKWYVNVSESHVPFVSPRTFYSMFQQYYQNTLLSNGAIWWDPLTIRRANLHLLPQKLRISHQQWCIICKEDMEIVFDFTNHNHELAQSIIHGHTSDESFIGVCLLKENQLKNVINTVTTLVDWDRSPNGNNPYTFTEWTPKDEQVVTELSRANPNAMFLRKISIDFPDEVIDQWIS